MDYTTLYQILAQANEENEKASPYAGFNDTIGQIGDASISLGAKSGDYKTGIIGALLSGVLGGAGKSLSNSWVADQNDVATGLLNDAISGKTISRPDGMTPSVFSKVQAGGKFWGMQKQAAEQQAEQQAKLELRNKIIGKAIDKSFDNPYQQEQTDRTLAELLGQKVEAQPLTRESLSSDVSGLTTQFDKSAEDVASKYKRYMLETQGNEALAKSLLERELAAPDKLNSNVVDIRKEFQGLPEIKDFVQSDIGFNSLKKAIKDDSSTSDLELIRGAIQAIEPGMAVREGEQYAVQNSQSLPDAYKGAINKALTGESALSPEVRQGILRIAERRYEQYANKFDAARGFYQGQLSKLGADPESLTYLQDVQPQSKPELSTVPSGAQPTGKTAGGKPVYMVDGQLWVPE